MSNNDGFKYFRGLVAKQKLNIDAVNDRVWKYYDYGPKDVSPLVFIPGASGTAEVFYKQFLSLCPKGYRLISISMEYGEDHVVVEIVLEILLILVQFPAYMTHDAWNKGFDKFLDKLGVDKVHLFGTSIGGYLAQSYIHYRPQRVLSLMLCNSFADTQYYKDNAPCVGMLALMPEFVLKKMILNNFPTGKLDPEIADSVDFMVQQLETLEQSELAARLTLNCTLAEFNPTELQWDKTKITILDTLDEVAVPEKCREELYKFYPEAKVAELKTGGNFPYLSRADETNLYLEVHLRSHGLQVNKPVLGGFEEEASSEKKSDSTEEQ